MQPLKGYLIALGDIRLMGTALKVSVIVGSVLLTINHGSALLQGKMTRDRWISGLLTYIVPYAVNIHGQHIARNQLSKQSDILSRETDRRTVKH